ncbi:MFS transporter [Streptomyces sp. NPDC051956]|uniref:MFS transporter n=1 Tax=Streptomyces sp. NPDC051956 TaxID=3365677 RepID=UPI0037D192CB
MALTEIRELPAPQAPKGRGGRAARLLPEPGPQRVLAAATLVNTFGSGMFVTSSALYFTRVVGLPMAQVALGLTISGVVGLFAGLAGGHVADRWGAKQTQIGVMVFGALFMTCYLFVQSFPLYLVATCLNCVVYAANPASRDPLIRAFAGERAASYRAYLQAMTNLAIALGALVAGAAIQLDTREAYLGLLLGRLLAFAACALVLRRLPHVPVAGEAGEKGSLRALRDRPFLVATLVNGVLELHYSIPTFALPLWIVGHTSAPRWTVSAVLLVNTLMVSALQVRAGRNVSSTAAAGRRMLWAGCALCTGLALIAAADGPPAWASTLILLCAMTAYTAGELWHAAASMEYAFGLAAPDAQGQYSGVFGFGAGVSEAFAPLILGGLVLSCGRPGWLVLGLIFLAVGASSRPLVRWAGREARRSS